MDAIGYALTKRKTQKVRMADLARREMDMQCRLEGLVLMPDDEITDMHGVGIGRYTSWEHKDGKMSLYIKMYSNIIRLVAVVVEVKD